MWYCLEREVKNISNTIWNKLSVVYQTHFSILFVEKCWDDDGTMCFIRSASPWCGGQHDTTVEHQLFFLYMWNDSSMAGHQVQGHCSKYAVIS